MVEVKWNVFLKDVFVCSLGAYGGPEAHCGVFFDQLVNKKKYLTEEELVQLIALTGILPGPSSTQTIISIGYKIGGPYLALLSFIVWALPAIVMMTILSFISRFFIDKNISLNGFRYVVPMAVGFIIIAAFQITKKVVIDKVTFILLLFGVVSTFFVRTPWIYPLIFVFGGVISVLTTKEKNIWKHVKLNPPWKYIILFGIFAIGSFILNLIYDNKLIQIFESFYRYGYLIIGGAQVVVPLMHTEVVELNNYMTNQEFLIGYGIVQGIPGPMFSFAAYAGGMAVRGESVITQLMGAMICGIAIFLPGVLLIYFVLPIWEKIKTINGVRVVLKGVTAVVGGVIMASALILLQEIQIAGDNYFVIILTVFLLFTKKIPTPIMVLLILLGGFIV